MPRKPSWPPRITRHPSGQARVHYRGRNYYLGAYGSEEAARAYAELLARLTAGEPAQASANLPKPRESSGVTVAEVVARWLAEEAPRYPAPGREVTQFKIACRPLLRLCGTLPAADFDCDRLERVQMSMARGTWQTPAERQWHDKRGKPCDWSRKVVNRAIVRLRTIWRWAERRKLVPAGSFAHLCTLPGLAAGDARVRHAPARKPATFDEVKRVCRHLPPVGKALLLLQWWTGMRSGEVRTMRAGEVERGGPVWVYRPAKHKMSHKGQAREVPIGRKGRAVLRPWLDAAAAAGADYVFPVHGGRKLDHYTRDNYAQMVRRAAKRAGLPGWHAYLCRHSMRMRATRAYGLDVARAILGQKSLDVTNSYGDALDLEAAKEAARRLG